MAKQSKWKLPGSGKNIEIIANWKQYKLVVINSKCKNILFRIGKIVYENVW